MPIFSSVWNTDPDFLSSVVYLKHPTTHQPFKDRDRGTCSMRQELPSVSRQDWDRASPGCTCRTCSPKVRALSFSPLYTKSHNSPGNWYFTWKMIFQVPLIPNKISHTDAQINKSEQCGVLKAEHRFIYNQVLMGSWINKNFAPYTLIPLCRKCLKERLS